MILTSKDRIQVLSELGKHLALKPEAYIEARARAYAENPWFTHDNIDKAVSAITDSFLNEDLLSAWCESYPKVKQPRTIGLIMAGNIPLVGFHDFLSVFVAGHKAQIKLSSKDEVLMKFMLDKLVDIEPRAKKYFELVERLNSFDAVIATGSNNTSRYFEYYFGKYPNIIRKNRNSVAVLEGNEEHSDFQKLGSDVFDYFGLGCRNVTKIYVPFGFEFNELLQVFDERKELEINHKYRNNFDYNYAIYLMNKDEILVSNNIILKKDNSYLSRIACLHYEHYEELDQVKQRLNFDSPQIQCIVTRDGKKLSMENEVAFGQTQSPALEDYADGEDTMAFLTGLS